MALGGEDGHLYFIEILGLEHVPLTINPTQALREKGSVFRRLFGKGRMQALYRYSCPQCHEVHECDMLPGQPFPCAKCGRSLRLGQVRLAETR